MVFRVLVTGANGFIGRHLICNLLKKDNYCIRAVLRESSLTRFDYPVEKVGISNLAETINWQAALSNCHVVIHAAARVHVLHDSVKDPLQEYRKINVQGTLNLAEQAAQAGVKRFIFLSTIKVNGEESLPGIPFTPEISSIPVDPYAISKYEAEQALMALSKKTGMEVVIIRPTLVYGAGVKGNFQQMMRWLKKGIPLPLGNINNKRSFVSVNNLVDLIITCIEHPNAANQVFLVSDGEDLSTSELLKKLSFALDTPLRLIPIPAWLLVSIGTLLGRKKIVQRLCGSLQVDISKTCELLEWQPIITIDKALLEATNTV